ncbi:MAG: hypothetical protein HY052_09125 [Proteobacteria bacterium]|nr:hypothetical protein [Pseudomonadota bacterium]
MMKKINIFTCMMIIAAFAVALRLFDMSNFSTPASVAQSTLAPQKFTQINEQPPAAPLTAPSPAPEQKDAKDVPNPDKSATTASTAPAATADQSVPPPASPMYGEHAYSAAELDVLQSLSKRRDELDKREQQMGQHEALLKVAEGEVDRKIAELNKIKKELVDLLNKQQTIQDERINSLVKIYESMKPKEAARIFDTLEMDVLLSVIGKMKENKSSPILANMDPEKARSVTIKLSEQHKLPDLPPDAKKAKPPATTPAAPGATTTPIPAPTTAPDAAPAAAHP